MVFVLILLLLKRFAVDRPVKSPTSSGDGSAT